MSVFSKIGNFVYRHKNKFFVSATVVTAAVLASKYAQRKLREWEESQTKEFLDRTRKQQHFESTERTCNSTFVSLSAALNEALLNLQNSEGIIVQLRKNPDNRLELWEKLKLSLIGGYMYKDTKSVSKGLQENYLSMCQLFLDTSFLEIAWNIEKKVNDVLAGVDLKHQLNLYDVENLFSTIQVQINEKSVNPISNLRKYVIPEEDIRDGDGLYNNMVRETADLLESEEVKTLASLCISSGFSCVVDKLSDFFTPNGTMAEPSTSTNTFVHPSNVLKPMAKIIPILNGLLNRYSFPDALIQQLISNEKLKILGANVYEVFSSTV